MLLLPDTGSCGEVRMTNSPCACLEHTCWCLCACLSRMQLSYEACTRHTHASPGAAMTAERLSFTTTAEVSLTLGAGACTCMRVRCIATYAFALKRPITCWYEPDFNIDSILPGEHESSCAKFGRSSMLPTSRPAAVCTNEATARLMPDRVRYSHLARQVWGGVLLGQCLAMYGWNGPQCRRHPCLCVCAGLGRRADRA